MPNTLHLQVGRQKVRKSYSLQITERLKIISKISLFTITLILKSITLYLRAMSSFVSKLIIYFFLLRIYVAKRAIGIH